MEQKSTGWSEPKNEMRFFELSEEEKKNTVLPDNITQQKIHWVKGEVFDIETGAPARGKANFDTFFYRGWIHDKQCVTVCLAFGDKPRAGVCVLSIGIDENFHILPGMWNFEMLIENPILLAVVTDFDAPSKIELELTAMHAIWAARNYEQIPLTEDVPSEV